MAVKGDGKVLGPHFVQGGLDTKEYLRIIQYCVIQGEFHLKNINGHQTWWQQDGTPAHTSNRSLQYLTGQFPGKVISSRGDHD